jgi:hypothetical protein
MRRQERYWRLPNMTKAQLEARVDEYHAEIVLLRKKFNDEHDMTEALLDKVDAMRLENKSVWQELDKARWELSEARAKVSR